MNKSIDLNADLGEGKTNDEALLKQVSSCNIACGGHVGNRASIIETIQLAQKYNVKIGAHPSYPDIKNFGRKSLDIAVDDLVEAIDSQLLLFQQCINETKAEWHHIKFHGALYNDLKKDMTKATTLVGLIQDKYDGVILYVPPNSVVQTIAESQIPIKIEGFADRAYNQDLSLVSRQKPNSVLTSPKDVIKQVKQMVLDREVEVSSANTIPIEIDSICIHGDTPQALEILEQLVENLHQHQIHIE